MRGLERFLVLGALVYEAIYIPYFLITLGSGNADTFHILVPLFVLGALLSLIAVILTVRDLCLRKFESNDARMTWAVLISMTAGIGLLVYIFKHALKPRQDGHGG